MTDNMIKGVTTKGALHRLDITGEIFAERSRQIVDEGFTLEHDDEHVDGDLAVAAAAYAANDKEGWPWALDSWNPGTDRRRRLIKAGALIMAEIERLDRRDAE
jgi:hypothetical protein